MTTSAMSSAAVARTPPCSDVSSRSICFAVRGWGFRGGAGVRRRGEEGEGGAGEATGRSDRGEQAVGVRVEAHSIVDLVASVNGILQGLLLGVGLVERVLWALDRLCARTHGGRGRRQASVRKVRPG